MTVADARCLSVHAGIEPCELVLAEADGAVETGGLGGDVVEPASAGDDVALGPGVELFWSLPAAPTSSSRSQPPVGPGEVGNGLAGLGAAVGAPPR